MRCPGRGTGPDQPAPPTALMPSSRPGTAPDCRLRSGSGSWLAPSKVARRVPWPRGPTVRDPEACPSPDERVEQHSDGPRPPRSTPLRPARAPSRRCAHTLGEHGRGCDHVPRLPGDIVGVAPGHRDLDVGIRTIAPVPAGRGTVVTEDHIGPVLLGPASIRSLSSDLPVRYLEGMRSSSPCQPAPSTWCRRPQRIVRIRPRAGLPAACPSEVMHRLAGRGAVPPTVP
jgi:hypothetical protein